MPFEDEFNELVGIKTVETVDDTDNDIDPVETTEEIETEETTEEVVETEDTDDNIEETVETDDDEPESHEPVQKQPKAEPSPSKKKGDESQPASEVEALRATIASLTAQLNDNQKEVTGVEPTSTEKTETEEKVNEAVKFELAELTDEQFAEITTDKTKFREFLADVIGKVQQDVIRESVQIASQSVARQSVLTKKVESFYDTNADLLPHRAYVGFVANTLRAKNPDWDLDTLLDKTNEKVRKDLAITQVAKTTHDKTKKTIAFPSKPTGASRGAQQAKVGKQQQMINEILT